MVTLAQVQLGFTKYVDEEILNKISGLEKWVIGVYVGLATKKSTDLFNQAKLSPAIKMLGIITDDDLIDIDLLYEELKAQAKDHGAVTFNVPMLGPLTLNSSDVDKLYNCIIAAQ